MRRAFLISLAAAWLCSTSSQAREPATAGAWADINIPYHRYVLPNGLTLIVHEDHKSPIVAVNIWYHVGSKDESPGHTGFAHLFEHLMFTSSENHPDEFFRPLIAVGGTKMNGNTWLDRTTYFETVPVNALDTALWLESDRMGHLLGAIDQHKLDEQRGVVQNEKRQGESRPYGKVDTFIAANTYPAGHPYSWTTIGSMEDLNAASLEDVKNWFRAYYGAANAVLVVAGDVNPAVVKEKVEHYFGDIDPGPVLKHTDRWIARMSGEKRATLQDRVPQPRIYKVWNIPGYTTRDFTLLQIAGEVLAGGKNSRLYKRLVYTNQVATGVSSNVSPFELGSQLQLIVTLRTGVDVEGVERALDEEVTHFLQSGPTRAELDRLKTATYAAFVRDIERVGGTGGKAAILGESQLYGGSPDFYQESLRWLRDATVPDVQNAARNWLADGVFVLTVVPFPEYRSAATGADRNKLPAVGTPPPLALPPLQRAALTNGLKVVLAERHDVPVVHLSLMVDAGHAADSLAKPGTSNLTLAMISEGTRTRDALQIAARADDLGAVIDAGSTLDTSYIALNAITPRLEESLELFSDVLLHPSFPQRALDRLKVQSVAAIDQQKSQPRGIASRVFPKLLYGEGHAYANPFTGIGTEASVRSITLEELQAFYRVWIRPDNATLLIVGDTTFAQIIPLLERYLAAWRAPAETIPVKHITAVPLPPAPRVFMVNRTGAEQTLLFAVELAPPRSDPDDIAFRAVNNLLGGSFVSRLNMNLREDKHWSYGAGSSLIDAKGPRPFIASAMVQTDRTADSLREMALELRDLTTARPPSATEIRAAKEALTLTLPGNTETSGEVAGAYADILTYGLPDTYLNDFVGQVQSLTAEQLQAAAIRLVHPQAFTWIVVGDLPLIEPSVRKLGLGEVTILDADGQRLR